MREHPDGAYKGARGLVAVTGYNGLFGYRTDIAYKTGDDLNQDQMDYLEAHPDFNWNKEIEDAKRVAEACKAEGWEFACHTWGHIQINKESVETISTDYEKWQENVQNIVGKTDTYIYIRSLELKDVSQISDRLSYLKDKGFHFFAGGNQPNINTWMRNYGDFIWQNRIDINGLRLWHLISGQGDEEALGLFLDADSVFDYERPTPVG